MPSFSSLSLYTLQALSLFTSLTTAYPSPGSSKILPRQTCTNSASDRSCWGDYDLTTNYYDEVPDTGVVREFYLELVNTTLAPDGVSRDVLTVNGTIPGPTLEADWGDTIVVHVTNSLQNNGTSIHFHGIRQNYTNQMDGVASITQCPTAPGDTMTYTWRATQYGSSWYHSHYSLQAWEGVFGGIVIHGPASANYDEDLGNLFLSDWDHQTADELYISAAINGPPTLDTGLINGTNVYDGAGAYFETTFISDTSYLIRVINVGIDTFFKFSIDNHTMTVIAMDFVPIEPFTTDILGLGIAQRYDIIVNATAPADNYWIRAIPQQTCSNNANVDGILGILRYDSTSTANPTSTGYSYTDDCDNEDSSLLVPYLSLDAGSQSVTENLEITPDAAANGFVYWDVNNSSMNASFGDPTLLEIMQGATGFDTQQNVYMLDTAGEWVYIVIEQTSAVYHPIHLHGHDFYVLASGTGTYASAAPTLNLANPPRRDVQMLPAAGYIVLAYLTDNPGAWLMHCHIGWHQSEGLDLQFIEQQALIPGLTDNTTVTDTCEAWTVYAARDDIVQIDSGV